MSAAKNATAPLQFFEHGRNRIAYRLFEPSDGQNASKTPLVMITGLSAIGTLDWAPFDAELGQHRPVLVFDNRLIGESKVRNKDELDEALDLSLQDLADDIIALVNHLRWKEIDLLGFSMGGMIAQTLALTPSLSFTIQHLVLTATSAKNPKSDLIQYIGKPPPKPLNEMSETELDDYVRPTLECNFSPSYYNDPANRESFERRVRSAWKDRRPLRTILAQSQAIGRYNVIERLKSLPKSMPVLIIHGKEDRAVYFSERQRLLDAVPHAEVAKMPSEQYGHFWYEYFSYAQWCQVLDDFLDRPAQQSAKL